MRAPLVLTVAANGFARVYRSYLASHGAYAARHGFAHRLVVPRRLLPPADAAWLKIALLARSLERHEWVLWVDADAVVRPACPDFRTVARPGGLLYLARGHSGRLNSGVIAACSHPASVEWLELLLDRADDPVPAADAAPYENGHVIHYARDLSFLRILEPRWNNMTDPTADDYVRHFTGPLRERRPRARAAGAMASLAAATELLPRRASRAPTGARVRALAAALYR